MSDKKPKKPRHRSPQHPAFDLQKAIERARELYGHEHFNYANKATVMGHWGYGPKSSSGLRTLAALIHFGLLDETGSLKDRRVKLSRVAKEILLRDEGSAERRAAIEDAALKPKIYRELWDALDTPGMLPSDRELRYKLEMELIFNPNAIDGFIADFRSTLEFAKLLRDGLDWDEESDSARDETSGPRLRRDTLPRPKRERSMVVVQEKQRQLDFAIPFMNGSQAIISTPAPLSDEDFKLFKDYIQNTLLKTFKPALTGRPADQEAEADGEQPAA